MQFFIVIPETYCQYPCVKPAMQGRGIAVGGCLVSERIIGSGVLRDVRQVLARHEMGTRILLVADADTWLAAGEHLQRQLTGYDVAVHCFDAHPHATMEHAHSIMKAAQLTDGLVAIGSGTINDITKYAAAMLGKPYIVVATAASMNGYTSATASLAVEGFKYSHPAKPPVAVIADLEVLCAAPAFLARAGLGDTLARSTVEADMMLSHFLFDTPYPQAIFEQLRSHEPALLAQAEELRQQTPEAIARLMLALLDAGDAMTTFGSSAVASQGEHMIAHTAEMLLGTDHLTHGELIALTTLTLGQIQRRLLDSTPHVRPLPVDIESYLPFGANGAALMDAYQKKLLSQAKAVETNRILEAAWPQIKSAIEAILLPTDQLRDFFTAVGIAVTPQQVHVDAAGYAQAVALAHVTRERFSFLDLAAMN